MGRAGNDFLRLIITRDRRNIIFSLTEEEMLMIAAKDLGHSEIVNHNDPMFAKMLHSLINPRLKKQKYPLLSGTQNALWS